MRRAKSVGVFVTETDSAGITITPRDLRLNDGAKGTLTTASLFAPGRQRALRVRVSSRDPNKVRYA